MKRPTCTFHLHLRGWQVELPPSLWTAVTAAAEAYAQVAVPGQDHAQLLAALHGRAYTPPNFRQRQARRRRLGVASPGECLRIGLLRKSEHIVPGVGMNSQKRAPAH